VTIRLRATAGALALLVLVPVVAAAQGRNPYAGLFGRAPQRTGRQFTSVQFRTQAGAQLGHTFDQSLASPDGTIPEGLAGGGEAVLALDHLGDRLTTQAHGRYAYQEYRQEPAFGVPAYDGGGQLSYKLTTRLAFDLSGQYMRTPFVHTVRLEPWAFGDQLVYPADHYASLLLRNDTVEGNAGFTSQYTKRSSLSAWGTWRQTDFADAPQENFEARGFRTRWRRTVTRNLGIHAGYGREEVRLREADDHRFMNELIDVGIDYAKSLSMARRTSLSFMTESTVLRENGGKGRFRLNGGIDLQSMFLRTWRSQLGVQRSTEFLPGYAAPVLSDRAHASVSGFLATRLIFYANADAGQASVGFDAPDKVRMYSADTRVTVAVSRHLGVFTQYYYYHYQTPPGLEPSLMLPRISRQTVSIGIQAWVPLVDKDKVTRDTR
jgi:hypothetical protein